ncbi:MAG: Gfo/Idh/MocA family oxidoreductase [Sulfurimonas sp.]|jgi:predicted dehydrogenase
MDKVINYSLIGANGYWSKNLYNTLTKLNYPLIRTVDLVGEGFSNIPHSSSLTDILNDGQLDAALIATPPTTHFFIAKECLNAGLHVFCEKPITLNEEDARELNQIAKSNNLILMVDLTWNYNEIYYFIKSALELRRFGKLISVKLNWEAFGRFSQVGVVNDLAPHPLSQIIGWLGYPTYISATGYINNGITESADIKLTYKNNFIVNICVSWLSPRKIRRVEVTTESGLIESSYDGIVRFIPFNGDAELYRPASLGSPLEVEMIHFRNCILEGKETLSSGNVGANIVRICELAEESVRQNGAEKRL